MPYNPSAPSWRTRQHPVNALLHTLGASGGLPTRAELDALPGGPRVTAAVSNAAREINKHRENGDRLEARRVAERTLAQLGPILETAPLPEPEPQAQPDNLDDLARRMFGNH